MAAPRSFIIALLIWLGAFSPAVKAGSVSDLTEESLREVARIARAISVVQPYLKDSEYIEYGLDIYRAARKYQIEPSVLIAIAQQETNFRNNLPEGRAGEIGIVQIRKMWLKNRGFKAEFHHASIKDLHKPAKSFMYAAWILRGLKNSTTTHRTLPYWSYYNAVRFENRYKYFLAVNRYVSMLRKNEEYFSERAVAASAQPARVTSPLPPAYRTPEATGPTRVANLESVRESVARWLPPSSSSAKRRDSGEDAMRTAIARWAPKRDTAVTKTSEQRWIPDAFAKIQKGSNQMAARQEIRTDRDFNSNLMRAATILDVKEYLPRDGEAQN